MITVGKNAPNFSLFGDDSQLHQLSDYRGRSLVIFFYPKDLTPGCTTEACEFSEKLNEFNALCVDVIGISKDSLASHLRFKSINSLRFLLLSDPDLAVHKLYGAYGEKTMYGKTSFGVIRTTILIDEKGVVKKIWNKVRVKNHVSSVLESAKKEIVY